MNFWNKVLEFLGWYNVSNDPIKVAAYFIAIVGYALFASSSAIKRKNHLLIAQSTGNFLCAVAEGINGLWSGLVQDAVNLIRNVFVLKKWMNKVIAIVFIALGAGIGLAVFAYGFFDEATKNAPWWGILPVIATVEYSIIILLPKVKVPVIKLSLMVSNACWAVYGYGMGFGPTMIFNIISFTLAFISVITYFVNVKRGAYHMEHVKEYVKEEEMGDKTIDSIEDKALEVDLKPQD